MIIGWSADAPDQVTILSLTVADAPGTLGFDGAVSRCASAINVFPSMEGKTREPDAGELINAATKVGINRPTISFPLASNSCTPKAIIIPFALVVR